MTTTTLTTTPRRTLAPSTPGGPACQFRVQHRTPAGEWRLHGTFHDRAAALACLADLQARGWEGRIVAVRICPFSA